MNTLREATATRRLMGRLAHGDDLLDALTAVCVENHARLGWLSALGAVQKARIGYYDQDAREYRYRDLDRHLEIASLVGNVSLKDGEPMVHAHITLADDEGRAFGGHLARGTIVFACEFCIELLDGPGLCRAHDEQTGLPLWSE